MQALSNRQQKKPGKLFAPGSSRAGFSIFVRALSKDPVEASWLRRFINLATSEPSEHTSLTFVMFASDASLLGLRLRLRLADNLSYTHQAGMHCSSCMHVQQYHGDWFP